jgi:hypothetical protein
MFLRKIQSEKYKDEGKCAEERQGRSEKYNLSRCRKLKRDTNDEKED